MLEIIVKIMLTVFMTVFAVSAVILNLGDNKK